MRNLMSGHGFFVGRLAGLAVMALVFSGVVSERAYGQPPSLQLTRVASGLSSPIFATHAPGDPNRLFIAEQGGNIRILDLNTGTVNATPFLTTAQLTVGNGFTGPASANERGLLGLTFDPNYATNRRFYVNYTGTGGHTFVRSFQSQDPGMGGNPNLVDGASGANIISINQPFNNHNGGWTAFGRDGFMYIGMGDGGGSNDMGNNALNRASLLGKMLRIAPNTTSAGGYTNPATNPYFGNAQGFREEIWAYGLRNPWRNSFDRLTGDLYMGDVGQSAREEINFQSANSAGGQNYGWRQFEGMTTTTNGNGGLIVDPDTKPIYDYVRGAGPFQGETVTGGYVYRGPIQGLQGVYFFGDYIDGKLWSLEFNGNPNGPFNGTNFSRLTDWTNIVTFTNGSFSLGNISSFGEDALGNMYLLSFNGNIYRFQGGSIPEPGMLGMGLLAITGLLAHRRRRA